MSTQLLDAIYLAKESQIFDLALLFGDGATIKKISLMNFLGSSPNNPFALLEILDCTFEMESGGKKDAQYITNAIKPIIKKIKETKDPSDPKNDLTFSLMEPQMFRATLLFIFIC